MLQRDGSAMSKRAEFWLWWFTDGAGRRRRTSYRMSCEEAMKRYPDAEPVAGSVEIRSLAGTRSKTEGMAGRLSSTEFGNLKEAGDRNS
jgi:hypothetical protein